MVDRVVVDATRNKPTLLCSSACGETVESADLSLADEDFDPVCGLGVKEVCDLQGRKDVSVVFAGVGGRGFCRVLQQLGPKVMLLSRLERHEAANDLVIDARLDSCDGAAALAAARPRPGLTRT